MGGRRTPGDRGHSVGRRRTVTLDPVSAAPSVEQTTGGGTGAKDVVRQAARRRTFAVISHPDAGKSTLTEALALHARVIGQAGAVHGKAGRRGTVSDWMDMERDRGISITSAALQFEYRDAVINLLDTPGHADFSEDTYRVLTAVDAAVMLIDAAKGLEAQTMKLFAVCRHRGIPVLTVVNKWDRPGKDALELMDEIHDRTGLTPDPADLAGRHRRRLPRRARPLRRHLPPVHPHRRRRHDRARRRPSRPPPPPSARATPGSRRSRRSSLLAETSGEHDQSLFLDGVTTPVLFASAVSNFGVGALLDTLVDLAPAPSAPAGRRRRHAGAHRPVQRLRVQGAGRHGHRAPRPAGVHPHLLGRLRARHGRHPRPHRPAVRDQVRPARVRPRAGEHRPRLPRRRRRPGQRRGPRRRRHPLRRRSR